MSMTQVAFLRKAEIPSKTEIEESINELGYEFKILDDFDNLYDQKGLCCTINGHETFFEIYFDKSDKMSNDNDWIKSELTDQDTAISFIWGADFAAGVCIGLISIALIDRSQALIYYLDDEMKYSREMLIDDTPLFLNELEKQNKDVKSKQSKSMVELKKTKNKKTFWAKFRDIFK
jgi:hypothetical protein